MSKKTGEKFTAKFEESNLTIVIERDGQWIYEIDLEEANNSAQMLDWIFQIHAKTWCTPQLLHDIITQVDEACEKVFSENPQGVFCPFGVSKKVNWKTGEFGDE